MSTFKHRADIVIGVYTNDNEMMLQFSASPGVTEDMIRSVIFLATEQFEEESKEPDGTI